MVLPEHSHPWSLYCGKEINLWLISRCIVELWQQRSREHKAEYICSLALYRKDLPTLVWSLNETQSMAIREGKQVLVRFSLFVLKFSIDCELTLFL